MQSACFFNLARPLQKARRNTHAILPEYQLISSLARFSVSRAPYSRLDLALPPLHISDRRLLSFPLTCTDSCRARIEVHLLALFRVLPARVLIRPNFLGPLPTSTPASAVPSTGTRRPFPPETGRSALQYGPSRFRGLLAVWLRVSLYPRLLHGSSRTEPLIQPPNICRSLIWKPPPHFGRIGAAALALVLTIWAHVGQTNAFQATLRVMFGVSGR